MPPLVGSHRQVSKTQHTCPYSPEQAPYRVSARSWQIHGGGAQLHPFAQPLRGRPGSVEARLLSTASVV